MARELEASRDEGLINRLLANIVVVEREYNAPENVIGPCWESQHTSDGKGYCQIGWRVDGHNLMIRVHRLSWSYHNQQEIPESMAICHHCDNRCCINPDHLFIGTGSDNIRDAVSKNRMNGIQSIGEDHNASKLTWQIVYWIRKHRQYRINGKRVTQQQMVDRIFEKWEISISRGHISPITRNESWPDPNWDPVSKTYTDTPYGWQESWGSWND